ncbi:Mpo1 family 2-hydroxy fatty acid dioxygenase [Oceanibacterium hippocampi]|uniref:DUF962 domain-containing protein n=1 Tax=Oceanibacterium hippocampi TaxID=745714 RepID=A0A1Y5S755_9PROT|nr:Mpo1-like protein [Oceanibacterium hippocampi]SLN33724.1 hypothetical protein OCH7691_01294 [Oceanibacterium hippocampi]
MLRHFFIEQMSMYSSYHRDLRNRATHFVGVPVIAFSLLIPMSLLELFTLGGYTITLATLFLVVMSVFYLLCDLGLGVVLLAFNVVLLLIADGIAEEGAVIAWIAFAGFFIGGWIVQLIGHAFEGRKPALTDNLLQVLVAPMFLVAESAFAFGWRKDLHDAVEKRWRNYLPKGEGRHHAPAH